MTSEKDYVLELKNIRKSFGRRLLIDHLDLALPKGRIFGLVGENESGKTTIIKMIVGLMPADEGEIFICGEKASRNDRSVYRHIGYVPDHFGMYHNLMVSEYMLFFAQAAGMNGLLARKRINEVLAKANLYGYEHTYIEKLSTSIRQRLCIALALLQDPELLLLDGPAKGIDSENRKLLRELYRELAAEGKTILITSHILGELAEFCTDIGILVNGSICEQMTIEKMKQEMREHTPIRIVLGSDLKTAIQALRSVKQIRTISSENNTLLLFVEQEENVEKEILQRLVEADATVLSFTRDVIDMESLIIDRIEKEKQRL